MRLKPKTEPFLFPTDPASWTETPFQPLVLKDYGVVVAGGPNGLFLFRVYERPQLSWTIPAFDRITGFAVQGGDLYVQDGTVLSRWNLKTGLCGTAVNLVQPEQRWPPEPKTAEERLNPRPGTPDWPALHRLDEPLHSDRRSLRRAQRELEWMRLYEWMHEAKPGSENPAAIDAMMSDVARILEGNMRDRGRFIMDAIKQLEPKLTKTTFSAPVVREHHLWGKWAGMVFVVAGDGTVHALDDTLTHLTGVAYDDVAAPSLALAEYPTDADDDVFECRLYYVARGGKVSALDGGQLDPKPVAGWAPRGRASAGYADPGVRMRVVNGVVWGSDAQGTAIFALPIDKPGSESLVKLPPNRDWRWLELRPEVELALPSALQYGAPLVSYAANANVVDRWAPRPAPVAPCFSTFLPASPAPKPHGRPLCVLELEQERAKGADGVELRCLVANTIDAPEKTAPDFRPPTPDLLMTAMLVGMRGAGDHPAFIRTQPSVSRQHAFVVARNMTRLEEMRALAGTSEKSPWRDYLADLMRQHHSFGNITFALDRIPLPAAARDRLYVYGVGAVVDSDKAADAWRTLERYREAVTPPWITLSVRAATKKDAPPDGVELLTMGIEVLLTFGRGGSMRATPGKQGKVQLPLSSVGDTVTLTVASNIIFKNSAPGTCVVALGRNNNVMTKVWM